MEIKLYAKPGLAFKNYLLLFLFGVLSVSTAHSQIISTVAGTGTSGYTGDGGPATSAQIWSPWSTVGDNYGNLYIGGEWWSGGSYSRVRKVDASGTITTYAGTGTPGFGGDGGPATLAQLYYPGGEATDAAGNLYISDYGNNRIRKVNYSTGIITTIAGNGTWGFSGDGGQATAATIANYWGGSICSDPAGNVYFYSWANYHVRKIDASTGIITSIAGNGSLGTTGDGGPATAAAIGYDVYGIAADGYGNVYIAQWDYAKVRVVNSSGIISTFAGNGGFGSSGDGGPATTAQIGNPIGVAVDGAGNVNIADYNNNRIRKVNASGTITTIAGTGSFGFSGDGGPATACTFQRPYGVGVDGAGNVYVADWGNVRVRKVTNYNRAPKFTGGHTQNFTVCENTVGDSINSLLAVMDSDSFQPESWATLTAPHHGIVVSGYSTTSTGSVLTAHSMYYTPTTGYAGLDTFKITVCDGYAFDTTMICVTVNPIPSALTGGASIAVGSYTTVSSATTGGAWSSSLSGIATVSSVGIATGVSAGTATITYTLPAGCVNTTTVNVFPYAGNLITTIAGNGTAGSTGDGGQATAAALHTPYGVAVDANGNMYIADQANNKVRKVNSTGVISIIAGTGALGFSGDGSAATAAVINSPQDVAVDAAGNVYIADAGNNRIRKINTSGIISTFAGNGSTVFGGDGFAATTAGVWAPSCVALDASGNVYISSDGTRIRKVNTSGIITTFAGNGTPGYSGDGGPATVAQLSNPVSVTADASGNILIADQLNNYIRKVNATTGIITSVAGNGSGSYVTDGVAATATSINQPWGIAADALGNIYIGDHSNNRVRKVNTSGIISTVAGTGTAGFSGDGCSASTSQINTHWGICTDGLGNVYIADGSNQRIRKIYSNHGPAYTGGHIQNSSVCENSVDTINSLLTITDPDFNQTETWTVLTAPVNGTVAASYSASSTGGTVIPVGLYYTPTIGFTGSDSFTVRVYDCGVGSDTTKIRITVTPPPSVIVGASTVCTGLNTTLTDPVGAGVWTSSSSATASVGLTTGVVTGVTAGPVTISFSPGAGCSVTKAMTVTASPAAIGGSHNVCMGTPLTLTDATTGGTWSSSSTPTVTIGSASGIANGVSTGTATITYTQGACYVTFPVTVNPATPNITGITSVCVGAPQALFDIVGGGVWSSASIPLATVDSFTGIVMGVSAGPATISYTLPTGCSATTIMNVDAAPLPITGSPTVCLGLTDTMSDATPGGGLWSTGGLGMSASIGSIDGVVTGLATGTQSIVFTSLVNNCTTSMTLTVNTAPSAINGADTVCIGSATTLSDAITGGAWSSSNPGVGSISTTGTLTGITAGTTIITYAVSGGCYATVPVTVRALPAAISGASTVCVGLTTLWTDASPGNTWTSGSTGIATVSSTGLVTGAGSGSTTITFTAFSGCTATKPITVNTSPALIGGSLNACIGIGTTLTDATPGGTWSSGTGTVATIGSTGAVNPLTSGTTLITYSIGAGCSTTATLTVNPIPALIGGSPAVCAGSTTTLSDVTPGGTWSASGTAATVGATTGTVNGVNPGTSGITYTALGCSRTITVTVNPLPAAIGGPSAVCSGQTITLTETSGGGSWTSSGTGSVTIVGGLVTGATPGPVTITYTLPTTCATTKAITVNGLPAAISGPAQVCQGANITLTDATGGGTWSTTATTATVSGGTVTGVTAGTATITYTGSIASGGCFVTKNVTINAIPAIIGPTAVCVTATMTEVSTPGGTWLSSLPGIATIGSLSGTVTGISTGTSNITYTMPTGCAASETITVSLSPTAIIGPSTVCVGNSTTYTDGVGGGAWSGSSSLTVGSLSGSVSGITTGPATITYSLGSTGCTAYKPVTVVASPSPITGATNVCTGSSITLSSFPAGGAWSSTSTTTGSISSTGSVTGVGAGTTTISYTVGGCSATATVSVNQTPAAISGPTQVCIGSTITEADVTPGGTWSASGTAVTIGSTGIVTGISGGTSLISYTLGSCMATRTVTVTTVGSISGATGVCVGSTTTLSCPGGGTWGSGSTGIATVGPTGIVSGISPGTSLITYTLGTGCSATTTVTVNLAPTAILGVLKVCTGATTALSNGSGGGTWSSGSTGIATIGTTSGIVTGITPGPSLITYSLGSGGCTATATVTVIASPAGITGPTQVCELGTITVADLTTGGTWTASGATVSTTGIVSGTTAGTATVSYTLSNGCAAGTTVTVNPLPANITGPTHICTGLTATLTDITGSGTWSSSSTITAPVSSTGDVTGGVPGTATITYTLPTTCAVSTGVTINPAPPAISGIAAMCIGASTTLADAAPGGTWSSSAGGTAGVSSTGVVSGITLGTADISYAVGGCPTVRTVTVNALPSAISGAANVCAGATTTLTDPTTGGSWSSSNPSIAGVSGTGVVTGLASGTVNITYSMGAGCTVSSPIAVYPSPAAISGTSNICLGATATLTDATPGGTWSSTFPTIAPISSAGVVSGLAGGLSTISYTISNGCAATLGVNVVVVPAITGIMDKCAWGDTLSIGDSNPAGSFSSSLVTVANMGGGIGIVTAHAPGTATIMYTLLPSGCMYTTTMTINPLPGPISGNDRLCNALTTTLSNSVAGGTWSSLAPAVATINTTGSVTGHSTGTAIIRYALPTGCKVDTTVTVVTPPTAISGASDICAGAIATLVDTTAGGTWSSSVPGIASVGAGTGVVSGMSAGTATITYTMAASCTATKAVTITPLPSVYTVSGGGNFCAGGTGVHVGLSGSHSGISYQLYNGTTSTGAAMSGTGGVLDFGLQTAAGVYTVAATDTLGGCGSNMSGSVTITINPTVTPSVTATVTPGTTVCAGTTVNFAATGAGGGSSPLYQWLVNGTGAGTGSTYSYTPANGDVVTVTLTSNAPCASPATVTTTETITVTDIAIPVVTITAQPGVTITTGQADTFTATVTGGGTTPAYQWEVNSLAVPGAITNTFIISTLSNQDTVSCVVTNNDPCGQTSGKDVVVTVNPQSHVGVTTIANGEVFTVLPNPNKGEFTIKGTLSASADQDVTIEVIDMLGQVIYRKPAVAKGGKLSETVTLGSSVANGMYMLNLRTETGSRVFHVVVEQ